MTGRLSTLAAAIVIARRDFGAILLNRSFIFFLLGPLFPLIVGIMAGGVGQKVQQSAERPELGIAMAAEDIAAMFAAREVLDCRHRLSVARRLIIPRFRSQRQQRAQRTNAEVS